MSLEGGIHPPPTHTPFPQQQDLQQGTGSAISHGAGISPAAKSSGRCAQTLLLLLSNTSH